MGCRNPSPLPQPPHPHPDLSPPDPFCSSSSELQYWIEVRSQPLPCEVSDCRLLSTSHPPILDLHSSTTSYLQTSGPYLHTPGTSSSLTSPPLMINFNYLSFHIFLTPNIPDYNFWAPDLSRRLL